MCKQGFSGVLTTWGFLRSREELGEAGILGMRWESIPQRCAGGGFWVLYINFLAVPWGRG